MSAMISGAIGGNCVFSRTLHWRIMRASQSNCWSANSHIYFFLYYPSLSQPSSFVIIFRVSHTSAWEWVASQQDWRNQAVTGLISWSRIEHEWKIRILCLAVSPGSAERPFRWDGKRGIFWLPDICVMFLPKIIKFGQWLFKLQLKMLCLLL